MDNFHESLYFTRNSAYQKPSDQASMHANVAETAVVETTSMQPASQTQEEETQVMQPPDLRQNHGKETTLLKRKTDAVTPPTRQASKRVKISVGPAVDLGD